MSHPRRPLSRRAYLAVCGATVIGLAGCSGADGSGRDGTDTERRTAGTDTTVGRTTDAPTETPSRSASVEEMEAAVGSVTFEGTYFDTHAHWLENSIPSSYADRMRTHDVGAAALFSPSRRAEEDYRTFLETVTDPGVEYLPFMSAPPPGTELSAADFRSLYDGNGRAFHGIGEFKPQSTNPPGMDEPPLTDLYELAADVGVPFMYHPKDSQEGTVEPAVSEYPETTFLLHGHQMAGFGQDDPGLGPTLPRLLESYDNLYWTVDVATMLGGAPFRKPNAAEFLEWYDSEAERHIGFYREILPQLLDAAPDRVVWGSDVAFDWHANPDVFGKFVDATERVLEGVRTDRRDAFRSGNALAMFGL